MSKLDVFELKVESQSQPILTGGVVRGDVLLRLKKDIDIARIMVHLYGAAQVEFVDAYSGGAVSSRGSGPACEDSETFVRMAQIVYSKTAPAAKKLVRGELYKCHFEFHLSRDLPSSFMTVIFYKLTAFLDCGGKSHEAALPLVVINDLDLNCYSGKLTLTEPIDSWSPSRSRTDTGLVSVRIVGNKRGFGFGETITLQVEIFNNSKAKLDNINACLVQKGILKAFSPSGAQFRRVQRLLVKRFSLGRLRNAERLAEEVKIPVPWVVTSEIERFTRLVEIEYYIEVTTSTQMLSAITGAPISQVVCIGPDYRKSEIVSVLAEEQIAVGVRQLREPGSQQPQQLQQPQHLYPILNGAGQLLPQHMTPSAPPPDSSDLTMFTMLPTAPPSYDEALTHQKAPLDEPMATAAAPAAAVSSATTGDN